MEKIYRLDSPALDGVTLDTFDVKRVEQFLGQTLYKDDKVMARMESALPAGFQQPRLPAGIVPDPSVEIIDMQRYWQPATNLAPGLMQFDFKLPFKDEEFSFKIMRYLRDNKDLIGLTGDSLAKSNSTEVTLSPQMTTALGAEYATEGFTLEMMGIKHASFQMFMTEESAVRLSEHLARQRQAAPASGLTDNELHPNGPGQAGAVPPPPPPP